MNYFCSEWYDIILRCMHSFMKLMWVCEKFSIKLKLQYCMIQKVSVIVSKYISAIY